MGRYQAALADRPLKSFGQSRRRSCHEPAIWSSGRRPLDQVQPKMKVVDVDGVELGSVEDISMSDAGAVTTAGEDVGRSRGIFGGSGGFADGSRGFQNPCALAYSGSATSS